MTAVLESTVIVYDTPLAVCLLYSVSQKIADLELFAIFHLRRTCVIENYLGYCANSFLRLHRFWSIFLNICINCITFTSKTT